MRIALVLTLACGCATYTVDARTLERAHSLDGLLQERLAIRARADEVGGRATWLRANRIIFARRASQGRLRVRSRSPLIGWGAVVFSVGASLTIAGIVVASEPDPPYYECTQPGLCINKDKLLAFPILLGFGGTLAVTGALMSMIGMLAPSEVAPNRAGMQYTGP
jgi:hypothetical protein